MKNNFYILLASLFMLTTGVVNAQNGVLEIYTSAGELVECGSHLYKLGGGAGHGNSYIATDTLWTKNTTDAAVTLMVRKIELDIIPTSYNLFCAIGQCYPPNTLLTPGSVEVAAGETTSGLNYFVGDYYHESTVGTSSIMYSFLSVDGEGAVLDSTVVTYHFSTTSVTPMDDAGEALYNREILINCDPSIANEYAIKLNNHTTGALNYRVVKDVIAEEDGHVSTFMFGGVEYDGASGDGTGVTIEAETTLEGDNGFKAIFNPNGFDGNEFLTTIEYRFFNAADGNDKDFVTLVYNPSGVGFNNLDSYSVSNAYPNPASNYFTVDYELPEFNSASLKVYGTNGTLIGEFAINETNGKANVSVGELSNGVYFYAFEVDGKTLGVEKIIIQK